MSCRLARNFDVVTCLDVLEHFTDSERDIVINNIDSHVKNQGILILSFPSPLYMTMEPAWKSFRKLIYPGIIFDDDQVHERLDIRQLLSDLENRGYDCVQMGQCTYRLIDYLVVRKVKPIPKHTS